MYYYQFPINNFIVKPQPKMLFGKTSYRASYYNTNNLLNKINNNTTYIKYYKIT
jgi:hypothetical protein